MKKVPTVKENKEPDPTYSYSLEQDYEDENQDVIYQNIMSDKTNNAFLTTREPLYAHDIQKHPQPEEIPQALSQTVNGPRPNDRVLDTHSEVNGQLYAQITKKANKSGSQIYQNQKVEVMNYETIAQPSIKVEETTTPQQAPKKLAKRETQSPSKPKQLATQIQLPQQQTEPEQQPSTSNHPLPSPLQPKTNIAQQRKSEATKSVQKQQLKDTQLSLTQQSQSKQTNSISVSSAPQTLDEEKTTDHQQRKPDLPALSKAEGPSNNQGVPTSKSLIQPPRQSLEKELPKSVPKEVELPKLQPQNVVKVEEVIVEPQILENPINDTEQRQRATVQETKAPDVSSSTSKVHGWMCPTCTLVNKWERPGCEACATERPGSAPNGPNDSSEKV